MKPNPACQSAGEAAQELITELVAALRRSTQALIEGVPSELSSDGEKRTRQIMRRIKTLSTFVSGESIKPMRSTVVENDQEGPASSAGTSRRRRALKSTPSSDKPDASEEMDPPRLRVRPLSDFIAQQPSPSTKLNEGRETSASTPQANFERIRAAFPEDDPIKELEEIKSRVFGSG